MSVQIQIENYRALRAVDATFDGVCLLVGPNGGGKTSLFNALRMVINMGLHEPQRALDMDGGGAEFNHRGCDGDALTQFRVKVTYQMPVDLHVEFKVRSSGYVAAPRYSIHSTFPGELFKEWQGRGVHVDAPADVPLSVLDDVKDEMVHKAFKSLFGTILIFRDFNVLDIKVAGSKADSYARLSQRGENVFSVLRNWFNQRAMRPRYEFVLRWMREAFGDRFVDMDFEAAGQTVTMRYYAKGDEIPRPIYTASNGMVSMLFNLVALVCPSREQSSLGTVLVCIDEPENGLHPHALRTFIEAARAWTAQQQSAVVLATHSAFLLDEFSKTPEKVFVMDPSAEKQLWRLDEQLNSEWLKQFMLGDLYGRDFARQGDDA